MTLIAALRCKDGVILASDSQQTRGVPGSRLARETQKVYKPRPGFMLAVAGAQDVAQEVALRVQRASDLSGNADRLGIKARIAAIIEEIRKVEGLEGASDNVEFLLAWWYRRETKPVALHVFSGGRAEWVEGWAFGGTKLAVEGATFTSNTLRYVDVSTLTVEAAKTLVLKTVKDTIESGVDGIGGRVQMGVVEKQGASLISDEDFRALNDALGLWEAQSADLLVGRASPPSLSRGRDPGVKRPSGGSGK